MTDRHSRWLLVAVLGCQFALFRSFVEREIAWAPPAYYDQAAYLAQAYGFHSCMLGPANRSCLTDALVGKHARLNANGVLLPVQAAALSFFLGASRVTVLSVVFAYYALWQIATFSVVRRLSGRLDAAWLALGLLLTAWSPFLAIGGLTDFRLDLSAAGALGVHIALVLASGTFADRRLSIAAAVVAGVLVLMRYLTAVYVAGIWLITAGVCAWIWTRRRSSPAQATAARGRLVNLGIAMSTALVMTGPSVWASRHALYAYYLDPSVDHRIWGSAGASWADGWLWYAKAIAAHHLGPFFLVAAGLVIGVAFIPATAGPAPPGGRVLDRQLSWVFLAACSVVPLAFLSAYSATSISAAGIVVPGLVGLLYHAIAVRAVPRGGWQRLRPAAIAAVCVLGIVAQARGYLRHSEIADRRATALETVALYDAIGRHCERMGWRRPRISTDVISEELVAAGLPLTTLYYERHRVLLGVDARLGGSVLGIAPAVALAALEDSDIVLLSADRQRPAARFPFEKDMERQRADVDALVKRRFVLQGRHLVGGRPIDVYVRPDVRIEGLSGGWVTDAGIALDLYTAPAGSTVVLAGHYPQDLLGPELDAFAVLVDDSGRETPLASDLLIAQGMYELRIVLPPGATPMEDHSRARISFSKWFPQNNGDPRRLVVPAPTLTRVELP